MKKIEGLKDLKYGLITVEQKLTISRLDKGLFDLANEFKKYSYPNIATSKKEIDLMIEFQNSILSKPNWKEYYKTFKEIDENLSLFISKYVFEIGIDISPKQLQNIYNRFDSLILYLKDIFNRPRPYQLAYYTGQDLKNFKTVTGHSPAYPSGHTFQGWLTCLMLIKKYPSKKNELLKLANIIEQSRVVLGYHFPSDNKFGKLIAIQLSSKK